MIVGINSRALTYASVTDEQVSKQFDALLKANIKWVRAVISWGQMEAVKGTWDHSLNDRMMDRAKQDGVDVLAILCGSPLWANGGKKSTIGPYPPTDIEGWCNYIQKVVDRYPEIQYYEIWNEQNIGFWLPKPSPAEYLVLLKAACALLHFLGKTVVLGGLSGPGWPYLQNLMNLGGGDYFDILNYHPYSQITPMSVWTGDPQENIAQQILDTNKALCPKPVWITEIGWTTCGWWYFPKGTKPPQQAEYITRVLDFYDGRADALFYYDLWDMSTAPFPSYHYGVLNNDFTEKPGLMALSR